MRPHAGPLTHRRSSRNLAGGRTLAALLAGIALGGCFDDPSMRLPVVPGGAPDLTAALQTLHDAASASPDDAEQRGRLAMAYDVNSFEQRAIVVYGQAAVLDPDEFNWPYFRALLQARVDTDYQGALSSLDAAIAIDDGYVPAWLSRGEWLRVLERLDEARTAYRRAADLGAGAPAVIGLARLLMDADRFDEAVAMLEPLNAETPDPRIEAQLARAYRGLGRDDDARIAAARAGAAQSAMEWLDPRLAQRAPYIAGFRNRLLHAQNLIQVGRQQDALTIAEELTAERPGDVAAINTLVWANAALDRLDAVQSTLREALAQHPEEPRLHQMMANAYLEQGDVANARRHLEKIIAFAPENARALEELGWLVARQGETEQGIALLERALESGAREPKHLLYRLGLLDGAAGRWHQAAERFRDAGRADAAFTMAFVHLGRCLAEAGDFDGARTALDWADRLGTHAAHRASARRRLAELQRAEL